MDGPEWAVPLYGPSSLNPSEIPTSRPHPSQNVAGQLRAGLHTEHAERHVQ